MTRAFGALTMAVACAFPLAVAGQQTPLSGTITVTGIARASGPVTGANVAVILHGTKVEAGWLEAALAKVGVTGFIASPAPPSAIPPVVDVRGRMPSAGREDVDAVTGAVDAFVKAHRGASILRLAFFGLSKDCPDIAGRAREAALADARVQAEAVAEKTGDHVGDVRAVVEQHACPPPGPLAGAYAIDLQTLLMTVNVEETVTYTTAKR